MPCSLTPWWTSATNTTPTSLDLHGVSVSGVAANFKKEGGKEGERRFFTEVHIYIKHNSLHTCLYMCFSMHKCTFLNVHPIQVCICTHTLHSHPTHAHTHTHFSQIFKG